METAVLSSEQIYERKVAENHQTDYYVAPVAAQPKPLYKAVKRAFDVLVSLLGLLVLGIPMLLLALLIQLDSEGPAIFAQERLGKDGVPFTMYKFRTMRLDAEKNGPQWASENDQRCTKLGRIIRKSRADELPQLVNVLKGEMSLVGPRPEREFFYEEFEQYIHGFSQRLKVTPGITGWAQVNGGYNLLPEEKIVYDMEYISNCSVWMDIKCLLRTVGVVFEHKGAR